MINGRPTQAPLNREEQKLAFENRKKNYVLEQPPTPIFPVPSVKEFKLSQEDQLLALQTQFTERGLQHNVVKVEKQLEENKTATTVQQFYCNHMYQAVKASWMLIPIRYKICQKCGLVK